MRWIIRLSIYILSFGLLLLCAHPTERAHAAASASLGITTTLTISQVGNGVVTAAPAGPIYNYGQSVTLSATPNTGWVFQGWSGDVQPLNDWWSQVWNYRVVVNVDANGHVRYDKPVEVPLNFTNLLTSVGQGAAFDPASLRVVEVNANAQFINENVPFQFDPVDVGNNANGTLIFLMNGTTSAGGGRTFHVYFDVVGKGFVAPTFTPQVTFATGTDEGQSSYVIQNHNATYYYHNQGGGFSSIVDDDGNDWINYNTLPGDEGAFRGLPNLITDGDRFRPGVTTSNSSVLNQGPLKVTVKTETADGQWEARWEFYPDYARMTVVRAPAAYWFTYGGTPGGALESSGPLSGQDVVFRSDGSSTNFDNSWDNDPDLATDEWVYIANRSGVLRSLFLAHHEDDAIPDTIKRQSPTAYFKFGRNASGNPGITSAPAHFTIGLMDDTSFATASLKVKSAYKDLVVVASAAQVRTSTPPPPPGSSPSFATDMTSNRTITATFVGIPYNLSITTVGGGSVQKSPDQATYFYGDTVTLTAVPAPGSTFTGWGGAASGIDNPTTVQITGDTAVTANFVGNIYTIITHTVGSGVVTVNPVQSSYLYSDLVTLTATASPGWTFIGWSGTLSSMENLLTFHVDSSEEITATFDRDRYRLTTIVNPPEGGQIARRPEWELYTYRNITVTAVGNFGWDFVGWGGDLQGVTNPSGLLMDRDKSISANFVQQPASTLASDDFNSCAGLDSRWNFINPLGDATMTPTGSGVQISVPGGVAHNVWADGNQAPRIMQTVNDVDFELETKFDSVVNQRFQLQGVIVEQDENDYLRFNVQSEGNGVEAVIIRFVEGAAPVIVASEPITDVTPSYLQVRRQGDSWKLSYSGDGTTWKSKDKLQLNHALTVSKAGVFFGNAASGNQSPPAFTGVVDYVFNTAARITPEDPNPLNLDLRIMGQGIVTRMPPCGNPVTLTAVGQPGWNFSHWSGNLSGGANPVNNYSFSSSTVITANFTAQPYRLTVTGNGVGTVTKNPEKATYIYGEQVTLTANPGGGWSFVNWSGDHSGNANPTTITIDGDKNIVANFSLQQPSTIVSDDFNRCALSGVPWTFINPLNDATLTMMGDSVQLAVPAGVEHNVWTEGNQAPRIMQPANNTNFGLDVKFDSPFTERYQLQGVLIEQDADDYLRINFQSGRTSPDLVVIQFTQGQEPEIIATQTISNAVAPLYLRVIRTGDTWQVSYSTNGIAWATNEALTFTHSMIVSQVGLFVGNAKLSNSPPPAHTAVIDFFFNRAAPISPEDSQPLALTTYTTGKGAVLRNPICGNPTQLTAVPGAGFTFAGWGGSLTGSQNPAPPLTFTANDAVTAIFVESQYQVTRSAEGNGRVTISPEQSTYKHGQVVTLTAVADPGWVFVEWDGTLSGTENPRILTITRDRAIRAKFEARQYPLTTSAVGSGVIERSLVKENYNHGDEVRLTATPSQGWYFAGWSGDLSGSTNPEIVIMDNAKNVIATFTQNPYALVINITGNGQVNADPPQTIYAPNEQVTLTAQPAPGWKFIAWGGVLSGAQNPTTLRMDGSKTVNAQFVEDTTPFNLTTDVVGSGAVQVQPAQTSFANGSQITLTAVANPGWTFTEWSGALTGSLNPANLLMNDNKQVTANFAQLGANQYGLSVRKIGEGNVTLSERGPYDEGELVVLEAIPAQGWAFTGWVGDYTGDTNPVELEMDATKTITATFDQVLYDLIVETVGVGNISVDQPGPYSPEQRITLTAVAGPGWRFNGWSGDLSGGANPTLLTMNDNKVVIATFTVDPTASVNQQYMPLIRR